MDTLQPDARCPPQLGGSRPAQRHSLCSPQLDNNCPAQLDNCPAQLDSAQHSWIPLPVTSSSPNPRVLWGLLAPCSACEGPTVLTGSPSFPVPGCCGSHPQPDAVAGQGHRVQEGCGGCRAAGCSRAVPREKRLRGEAEGQRGAALAMGMDCSGCPGRRAEPSLGSREICTSKSIGRGSLSHGAAAAQGCPLGPE